ncbi:hypothetical protein H072_11244 [Dactylellina haptotyla CBS 200.50]|uniref:Uncharacterized protein n=1 Tax=Dactylellina haptotyla (strain CBS 200.50) TaxID=1284197 RepID=S8BJH8_DACHA|nr:hypothetical protein H072_11244 [Dactylellina haptotyla CBS 200.50]
MTCKVLNRAAQDTHLDSIYRSRRVFYTPASFENLLKISKHSSGVNLRVREIIVTNVSPYKAIQPSFRDSKTYKEADEEFRQSIHQIARASHNYYTGATFSYIEQPESFQSALSQLTLAFAGLPNIESIRFNRTGGIELSRSELNLFYPGLTFRPGTRLPDTSEIFEDMSFHFHISQRDQRLSTMFYYKIIGHLPRLRNLEDRSWPGLKLAYLQDAMTYTPRIEFGPATLRVLKLMLNFNTFSVNTDIAPANEVFVTWLEAVGTNLESISLRGLRKTLDRVYISLPTLTRFPKLRKLSLGCLRLSVDNFEAFLGKSSDTLQVLKLDNIRFKEPRFGVPDSQLWYRILRFLKIEVLQLRKFTLRVPDLLLPSLEIKGGWGSPETICQIESGTEFSSIDANAKITERNIEEALMTYRDSSEFWKFMSNR